MNVKEFIGNHKPYFAVPGAVLLGAAGTALWELMKPLTSKLYFLVLDLATLGLSSQINNMYLEIAKGLHEKSSIQIYVFIMAFVITTGLILSIFYFRKLNQLLKKSSSSHYREAESVMIELEKSIKWFETWGRKIAVFFLLYSIFCSVFLFVSILEDLYINDAIVYYSQLEKISAPYLSEKETIKINSDFSKIKTRADYIKATNELVKIIRENNDTPPEFKIY